MSFKPCESYSKHIFLGLTNNHLCCNEFDSLEGKKRGEYLVSGFIWAIEFQIHVFVASCLCLKTEVLFLDPSRFLNVHYWVLLYWTRTQVRTIECIEGQALQTISLNSDNHTTKQLICKLTTNCLNVHCSFCKYQFIFFNSIVRAFSYQSPFISVLFFLVFCQNTFYVWPSPYTTYMDISRPHYSIILERNTSVMLSGFL